jgi:hypothetical protein
VRPATSLICQFIDEHKGTYGVVPICRAAVRGVQIAPRTYWAHRSSAPSKRALWDTTITEILGPLGTCCGLPRDGVATSYAQWLSRARRQPHRDAMRQRRWCAESSCPAMDNVHRGRADPLPSISRIRVLAQGDRVDLQVRPAVAATTA